MSSITVRIKNPRIVNLLDDIYKNKTEGATTAVKYWPLLRLHSLKEIKGLFSDKELYALLDIFNDPQIDPFSISPSFIATQFENSCNVESIDKKYKLNSNLSKNKINSLSSAQAFALIDWVSCFWKHDTTANIDKYEYVTPLLTTPDIGKNTKVRYITWIIENNHHVPYYCDEFLSFYEGNISKYSDKHIFFYEGIDIPIGYEENDPFLIQAFNVLGLEAFSQNANAPKWITIKHLSELRFIFCIFESYKKQPVIIQNLSKFIGLKPYSIRIPDKINTEEEYNNFLAECFSSGKFAYGYSNPGKSGYYQ